MGICFPLFKSERRKYVESEDIPTHRIDSIQLKSSEFISSLKSSSDHWVLSQENLLSLYSDFTFLSSIELPERIRSSCMDSNYIVACNKEIEVFSYNFKSQSKLSGHEKIVNSVSLNNNLLLSGSADWTIRLWDVFSETELNRNLINWNVVTSLMWKDENTAIQTSEDLRLRVWDIREKSIFKSAVIGVGDNFATCCDVRDEVVVTGHRGCNGDGCEIKFWDLRKKEIFVNVNHHSQSVESVKFLSDKVISAGKDGKLVLMKNDGSLAEVWNHDRSTPFVAMERFKEGILTANLEPKVMFFNVEPLKNEI
jgi:WD40 repeat protein